MLNCGTPTEVKQTKGMFTPAMCSQLKESHENAVIRDGENATH